MGYWGLRRYLGTRCGGSGVAGVQRDGGTGMGPWGGHRYRAQDSHLGWGGTWGGAGGVHWGVSSMGAMRGQGAGGAQEGPGHVPHPLASWQNQGLGCQGGSPGWEGGGPRRLMPPTDVGAQLLPHQDRPGGALGPCPGPDPTPSHAPFPRPVSNGGADPAQPAGGWHRGVGAGHGAVPPRRGGPAGAAG